MIILVKSVLLFTFATAIHGHFQLDERDREREELTSNASVEDPCSDVTCEEDMKCMLYLVNCGSSFCPPVPTCFNMSRECASCASNCVVIGLDGNQCPTCACGANINNHESESNCNVPHCFGENCHLLVSPATRCPVCSCDDPCSMEDCPPGCNVIMEIEGRCPKCICENDSEGCPTPICEDETCRIESPPGGCPTCICDNRGDTSNPIAQQGVQQQPQREFQDNLAQDNVVTENLFFEDSNEDDTIELMSKKLEDVNVITSRDNTPESGRRQP